MNVCDILSSHLGEQYAIANAINIIAEIESYGDCRHCGIMRVGQSSMVKKNISSSL